ncbi:MAG: hypothetical protein U1E49_17230 [Hyphomicrobiaceae bacterium]
MFFDERMNELEASVLRIAITIFSTEENENLFETLTKNASESIPLLKAADGISKIADGIIAGGDLALSAGKVVTSVIAVGKSAFSYGRRLGPIYRDTIELDMVTTLSSLQGHCNGWTDEKYVEARAIVVRFVPQVNGGLEGACETYSRGALLWNRGAGALESWKSYLSDDASRFREYIIPTEISFIQVSDLIWRACDQMTDDKKLKSECMNLSFDENSKRWVGKLILGAKVVEYQDKRQSKADARLYALSQTSTTPVVPE